MIKIRDLCQSFLKEFNLKVTAEDGFEPVDPEIEESISVKTK